MLRRGGRENRDTQKNIANENSQRFTRSQTKNSKSDFRGVLDIFEPHSKGKKSKATGKKTSESLPVRKTERNTTRSKNVVTKKNCRPVSNSLCNTQQIITHTKSKQLNTVEKKTVSNSRFSVALSTRSQTKIIAEEKRNNQNCASLERKKVFVKLTNYKENSIILAKQKYSVPWPARILKVSKDRIKVYFFGDKREGTVNSSEIYDFKQSVDAVKLVLSSKKTPRGYATGIREIELLFGIPISHTIVD